MRRPAFLAATLTALAAGVVAVLGSSPPASAALPTAAVALGDSFISGEGAGGYQPVVDVNGVAQGFPGWSAANNNAFFCHRSANASLHQAALPGIQARFNLACSGGQPHDIANASASRRQGPRPSPPSSTSCGPSRRPTTSTWCWSASAPTTARSPSATSPRSAPTGSSPTPGPAGGSSGPTSTARSSRSRARPTTWPPPRRSRPRPTETTAAVRQLLTTLDQIDADGQHRIVFQDYTNPLPFDLGLDASTTRTAGTTTGTSSATWAPSGTRPAARSTGPASPPGTLLRRPRHHGPRRTAPRWPPSSPPTTWSTSTCSGPSTAPGSASRRAARPARWPPRSGCRTAPTGVLRDQPVRQGQDRHPADRQHLRHVLPDLPGVLAPQRGRPRGARPVPGRGRDDRANRTVACVRQPDGRIVAS